MRYLIVFVLFLVMSFGSVFGQKNIPELRLEKALNSKHTMKNLSELSDRLEYVKLETSSECLINRVSRIYPVNDGYLINDSYKRLLFFDKTGKFVWEIDRQGKGPGEYSTCMATYDQIKNEILIRGINKDLLVFDLDGKYLRTDPIGHNIVRILTMPDGNFVITRNGLSDGSTVKIINPTGELLKAMPDLYPQRPTGYDEFGRPVKIYPVYMHKTPNGVMIHKQDSVWTMNSEYDVVPILSTDNSVQGKENSYYGYLVFYFDSKRIGFQISWNKYQGIYDLESEKFYRFNGTEKNRLIDDIDGGIPFSITYCTNGIIYNSMNPVDLLEGGYVPREGSKLAKLISESTEEDNPILRLVYLK